MNSIILEKGESYHTNMGKIFEAIENEQIKYNWLITNCEVYPIDRDIQKLFSKEYIWISGEKLTEIIAKENFQIIWGVFSGFSKDINLEEVLQYELPFVDGNDGYWKDNLNIQHPLAEIEIAAIDSSFTILLSKNEDIAEKFISNFPMVQDLSLFNRKK